MPHARTTSSPPRRRGRGGPSSGASRAGRRRRAGRIADDHGARRNVLDDHRTRADDRICADRYLRKEYRPGADQRAASFKLFGNMMLLIITGGLADVYKLGRSLGIDPKDAFALFGEFNPGLAVQG